jgi:hypothetical protein
VQSGRSTAREWARRLEAWDRSGLDAEAFVKREGGNYTVRTLKWWRSELRRRARSEQPRTSSNPAPSIPLVRVQVKREPTVAGVLEVDQEALTRFLQDGRLRLDNNPSELALRGLVVGRRNWLFVGSDEHAETTATIISLVASAKLHDIEPERYLRDLARLLPIWPKARALELAPKYWKATRARLDATQLKRAATQSARLDRITIIM